MDWTGLSECDQSELGLIVNGETHDPEALNALIQREQQMLELAAQVAKHGPALTAASAPPPAQALRTRFRRCWPAPIASCAGVARWACWRAPRSSSGAFATRRTWTRTCRRSSTGR